MAITPDKDGKLRYKRPPGRPTKYNFSRLTEIGDSAYYAVADAPKVRAAASNHKARQLYWNYTTRFVDTGIGPRLELIVIPLEYEG